MNHTLFISITAAFVLLALLAGGLGGFFYWKKRFQRNFPAFDAAFLEKNQQKEDYRRLHALLSGKRPLIWLFAGDSITQGCQHTGGRRSFSEYFEQYLQGSRPDDIVINTGVSGAATQDLADHFDAWITAPQARAAFLCFGTNDCSASGMTVDTFRGNLTHAIDALEAGGAIPVLQTPCVGARQARLRPYLKAVRDIAETRELLLIDVNRYWKAHPLQSKTWMSDALHPNAAGHLAWCRFLLSSLGILEDTGELWRLSPGLLNAPIPQNTPSPEEMAPNTAAREALRPYIENESPVTWVFAGGSPPADAPVYERGYMQHVQEILRWELARTEMAPRCKTMIDLQRQGRSVSGLLNRYGELAGRFRPQVLFILPDVEADAGPAFAQSLPALVEKAVADKTTVVLQTPFAIGETAKALRETVLRAAKTYGVALVDHTALLERDPASSRLIRSTGRRTAEGELVLARHLCFTLADVPRDSRMCRDMF